MKEVNTGRLNIEIKYGMFQHPPAKVQLSFFVLLFTVFLLLSGIYLSFCFIIVPYLSYCLRLKSDTHHILNNCCPQKYK